MTDKDEEHRRLEHIYWASSIAVTATAVLISTVAAYFAYGAAVGARKQADAAQRQLEMADRQARWQYRPYVHLEEMAVPDNSEIKNPMRPSLLWKNYGQTPAYHFSVFGVLKLVDRREDQIYDGPEFHKYEGGKYSIIDPQADLHIWIDYPMSDGNIASLKSGKSVLVSFGYYTYSDAFNVNHWGDYCWWIDSLSTHGSQCRNNNDEDEPYYDSDKPAPPVRH